MTTLASLMQSSEAAFGTSGVRGLVTDLDDATVFAYTAAFLDHLKRAHGLMPETTIWVAHDLRPSSPKITAACLQAIAHAGMQARYCGAIPTPALAFSALQAGTPAVMVTGSHIPFDRNGMKFFRADGEMMKEDEAPVTSCGAAFPDDQFNNRQLCNAIELPVADNTAEKTWLHRYHNGFAGALEGKRIGHYQHSAAGRDLLSKLLEQLGATVVPLGRSETFVPIDTEAVSAQDQQQAMAWASEHALDALISTDGDGDRPLLAGSDGNYLRGDTLGILAASALGATHVVTPVSSNSALELRGKFGATSRTPIGSPHVIAAMNEATKTPGNAVVGFEANGGFLTATPVTSPWNGSLIAPLPTRDAVLPVLAVLAQASKRGVSLAHLQGELPQRITASDRLENTPREASMELIESLQSGTISWQTLVPDCPAVTNTDLTDGLRTTFEDGAIIHLRPSGNAPELRIYVEESSPQKADILLQNAKANIARRISE